MLFIIQIKCSFELKVLGAEIYRESTWQIKRMTIIDRLRKMRIIEFDNPWADVPLPFQPNRLECV